MPLEVVSATYGSAERRVDVAAAVAALVMSGSGETLTLAPDASVRQQLCVGDPAPGVPKVLRCVFRWQTDSSCPPSAACLPPRTTTTPLVVTGNGDGSSASGKEKAEEKGREFALCVAELGDRWARPLWLSKDARLEPRLGGGLCNQLYILLAAARVARATRRRVVLPFRMYARRTAEEGLFDRPVSCEALLDLAPLRALDEAAFPHLELPAAKTETGATEANLRGAMVRGGGGGGGWRAALGECYAPGARTLRVDGLLEVAIRNAAWRGARHFDASMRLLRALAPAPRLAAVAAAAARVLAAAGATGALHVRAEADWAREAPQHLFGAEQTLAALTAAVRAAPGVAGSAALAECTLAAGACVYIVGGAVPATYLARLRAAAPERRWIAKVAPGSVGEYAGEWKEEDAAGCALEALFAPLGFEEAAVVDRELALRAPAFVGFEHSSLSTLVALERFAGAQPWALYGREPCGRYLFTAGYPIRESLPGGRRAARPERAARFPLLSSAVPWDVAPPLTHVATATPAVAVTAATVVSVTPFGPVPEQAK